LFRASNFDLKIFFAECFFLHSAKRVFAECQKTTLGKEGSLPSVKKTLGKEGLCRVFFFYTRRRTLFVKCFLPSVFSLALGKEALCRMPEKKNSANHYTLGKEPDSGSGTAPADPLKSAHIMVTFCCSAFT